jgi:selenocysteine lyase/cysteine desulfurase
VLAADPGLLDTLHPDKLMPSTDAVPERFELGTLPYELMAGTTAAVDFIATLDDTGAGSTRRERIELGMKAVHAHERTLLDLLEPALRAMNGVTVHSNARSRTPTLLFTVAGRDPQEIRGRLAERGVNAPAGHFYAIECSRHLGLGDSGGVRVGLAPYTSADDIDRLITGLTEIV